MVNRTIPMRTDPSFNRMVMKIIAREIARSGVMPNKAKVTRAINNAINEDLVWNEFIKM